MERIIIEQKNGYTIYGVVGNAGTNAYDPTISKETEVLESYSCDRFADFDNRHLFIEGQGWLCPHTNMRFCDECVASGEHMECYRHGEMTDRQIFYIDKTFIKI